MHNVLVFNIFVSRNEKGPIFNEPIVGTIELVYPRVVRLPKRDRLAGVETATHCGHLGQSNRN